MREREIKRKTVRDDGDERESNLTRENTLKIITIKNDEKEREKKRDSRVDGDERDRREANE
jgi:hypothetical protein